MLCSSGITIEHEAVDMRTIKIITSLMANVQRTTVPGNQHYRLSLDELHNTVNHRKRSTDTALLRTSASKNIIFGGGLACGDER